jgi:diguanylate cyclase (GGDEF)-like protein
MASRYRSLALYSVLLAALTGAWLARGLMESHAFPPWWAIVLCVAACLFVWLFGLPAPRVGLISMERVPQVGLLLVFDAPVAASICAVASLMWPLLNRRYSQGSLKVAAIRAVHNPAMTVLMLLIAGGVYQAAGGRRPLESLSLDDIMPLLLMALAAQAVNIVLMTLFFLFDGRDVRRIMTPAYALTDLIFVPAGVLAALLYTTGAPGTFGLFVALMVVFVLSFNGIGRTLSAAKMASDPLLKLAHARSTPHGARRLDELGERIVAEARALFRFDEFFFALVDREQGMLDVRVHELRGVRQPAKSTRLSVGLFGQVAERAEGLLIKDWKTAPEALQRRAVVTDKETGSVLIVPLIESGTVIGLLSVQHTQAGLYSEADLHLMKHLAEQVAAAVADARAEHLLAALGERSRTLERESHEDPLTGIANRRFFTQRLSAAIEIARALGQPLTVAVADLDRFKVVNDRLGHPVGDEVLRQSATLMRRFCRETDIVARIGGEEFALILPGLERLDAMDFCDRLRQTVDAHDWHTIHSNLHVTLSIGIAQWDGTGGVAELLQAADTQLYRAKHSGRNRVA